MAGFGTFMQENVMMASIPTIFFAVMLVQVSALEMIQAITLSYSFNLVVITGFRIIKLLLENLKKA